MLFCLDITQSYKSNILAKENKLISSGGTLYYPELGAPVTNEFLVYETQDNVYQGIYSASDTSPSVYRKSFMVLTNSGAISITEFDNGVEGQIINFWFSDGNTTIVHNASKIVLAGAANFTGASGNVLQLLYKGGIWYEIARRT